MTTPKKLFVAYETGEWRPSFLKTTVKEVFKGWEIKFGGDLMAGVSDRIFYKEVLQQLKDSTHVIVDLTGEKRSEDSGINLNALMEFGMALALERECYAYAIYCSPCISRPMIEKRISDIKGCPIDEYKNQAELLECLKKAKAWFEKNP